MKAEDEGMEMLFAFPDGSDSFVHGFEAGKIWAEIDENRPMVIDRGIEAGFPIHAENLELIRRMAAARGYTVEVGKAFHEWIAVRLTFTGSARPSLKVVQQ